MQCFKVLVEREVSEKKEIMGRIEANLFTSNITLTYYTCRNPNQI